MGGPRKNQTTTASKKSWGLRFIWDFISLCFYMYLDRPRYANMRLHGHDIEVKRAMGICVGVVVGVLRAQEQAKYFKN